MDVDGYEDATIVHDLTEPLPAAPTLARVDG